MEIGIQVSKFDKIINKLAFKNPCILFSLSFLAKILLEWKTILDILK